MPDRQPSRCMKSMISLKSVLLRDGIGDDSMSIRASSGMRHVIDSYASAPIKGSMRRGEGSMRRSLASTVLNGTKFPSIRGRRWVILSLRGIRHLTSSFLSLSDHRFDQSMLLELEQSFADAANNRLRKIEQSIMPKKRKNQNQNQNHLPMDPSLPSETAPPRDVCDVMHRKLEKEKLLLIKANPAAFQPEIADKAEARHQTMVEVARMRYEDSVKSQFQDKDVDQFFKSLTGLRVARPFFLPPIYEKDKIMRQRVVVVKQKVWSLDKSLFAQRAKETENKQLFDDEKIRKAQFDLDWMRVVSKERFKRQIGIVERGKSKSKKNVEEELSEVQEEIFQAKDALRSIFLYYSSDNGPMDSMEMLMMTLEQWMSFCSDIGLMEGQVLSRHDIQRIFSAGGCMGGWPGSTSPSFSSLLNVTELPL